ncbi:MAG: glutamate--tRNA ligase [Saprospiraceae bacterium]|nr:glutamate--tRNA ligase [Saprospiraceae bacterium]
MTKDIRLRFAPSPTGALHIGGLRTALYNYLLVKKLRGQFILRIEDTDQTRFVPGAEEYIINCLKWAGLIPDEGVGFGGDYGPYRQSERSSIYRKYALQLIDQGKAYYAFDSTEDLERMRTDLVTEQNTMPKYDFRTRIKMRNSLNLPKEETEILLRSGTPHVIRLCVPPSEQVKINDVIRGEVVFNSEELDDKVLIKSDGLPTYHMANVIDDRLMKISHVVRGEEWLSSTAHHVLLYRFFGWEEEMPVFAHLPLILKPNGKGKLSKRDGAEFGFPVFPMNWITEKDNFLGFKEFGFLPEAVLNFLALLGWNDGTKQEIYSLSEMIEKFSLEQIGKSGARFDFEKAKWFNAQYIQKSSCSIIKSYIVELYKSNKIKIDDTECDTIYSLYKDRVQLLTEFYSQGKYLVSDEIEISKEYIEKKWNHQWYEKYSKLISEFVLLQIWDKDSLESVLKNFMERESLKMGELLPALRVMMSGIPTGPDIYLMINGLSKDKFINKLKMSLEKIKLAKV